MDDSESIRGRGFTGTKTVYVDDGFGGQTTEDWTFENGVPVGVV